MKLKSVLLSILAPVALAASAHAELLFTQYYEGPGTNKWLELTNTGEEVIDLSIYTLSLYSNANREAWKTASGPVTASMVLTGTLNPGESLIVGNSSNGDNVPYAKSYTPIIFNTGSSTNVANFNGDDSITLWNNTGGDYTTSALVDVISFATNAGADISFIRISTDVGYNLDPGSSILDFSAVWTTTSLDSVNEALPGTNERLGYFTLSPVPEPGTVALLGLGAGAVLFGVRRKRR